MHENRPRLLYLDALRVLSCFAVVLFHLSIAEYYRQPAGSAFWTVSNILANAMRFCVPVFVMISGALFLSPERQITIRSIWLHSLLRLAVLYGVWSLLYALVNWPEYTSLYAFARAVVYGPDHLWFLWMLAGLYILTPLLRPAAADQSLLRYGMILAALGGILVPVLRITTHLALLDTLWTELLFKGGAISGYLFYYLAGAWLARVEYPRAVRRGLYLAGAAALVGLWFSSAWFFRTDMYKQTVLVDFVSPLIALYSVALFTGFKHLFSRPHATRLIGFVAPCTLGIYVVHPLVQSLVYRMSWLPAESRFPLFCVLWQTAVCFGVSLVVTALWRRMVRSLPKRNR